MTEQTYDAELHDAKVIFGNRLIGKIYEDKKMRFRDGETVTIGTTISQKEDIVTTKRSSYKLVESIKEFSGDYRWLSNFWPSLIVYEGRVYPSGEHAFVAAKTENEFVRERIADIKTAGQAKRFGRQIELRENWEDIKISVMAEITSQKYQNSNLRPLLLSTGNRRLYEGNTWGDTFWGICNGKGKNHLGKILMNERQTIRGY